MIKIDGKINNRYEEICKHMTIISTDSMSLEDLNYIKLLPDLKTNFIPNYMAQIKIGENIVVNITDKVFTDEQIKNIKEMFGFEVTNLVD